MLIDDFSNPGRISALGTSGGFHRPGHGRRFDGFSEDRTIAGHPALRLSGEGVPAEQRRVRSSGPSAHRQRCPSGCLGVRGIRLSVRGTRDLSSPSADDHDDPSLAVLSRAFTAGSKSATVEPSFRQLRTGGGKTGFDPSQLTRSRRCRVKKRVPGRYCGCEDRIFGMTAIGITISRFEEGLYHEKISTRS